MNQSYRDFFSKPKDLLWIFASVLLLYVFLCTFPVMYSPLGTGLDESWAFALNSLAGSADYFFGRDVNFTYGPLGYLLAPRIVSAGSHPVWVGAFWLTLQVSLFAASCFRLRHQPRTLALFCVFYLCLCVLGIWPEYRVLFAICVLCMASLDGTYTAVVCASLASLFAALTPETKWSLGFASLSVLLGSWILLWIQKTPRMRITLLVGITTFVITFATLQFLLFRTLADWRNWIALSFEITRGYSSAMSITGENAPLILALFISATLFSLMYLFASSVRRYLYLFAPLSWIAFKEGFVRQDGHRIIFFLAVAAIPTLLLLSPGLSRADRSRLTVAFAGACAVAVWYTSHFPAFSALETEDVKRFFLLNPGAQNVHDLLFAQAAGRRMRAASNDTLKSDVLQAEWRKAIGKATVSILPWEISIAAANQLKWRPLPTLQLYNAYTRRLDRITADAIGNRGAQFLLVDFLEIDGRNLVLDDPLTWRSILQHYELKAFDSMSQRLLLSRKATVVPPTELQSVSKNRGVFDKWVDVPSGSRLLYASVKVETSPIGRLAELLYHLPALYIQLQRVSGRTSVHRILPKTAPSGMLINFIPETGFDLSQLIQGAGTDPVAKFLITDLGGSAFFEHKYTWELLAGKRSVIPPVKQPEPPLVTDVKLSNGVGRSAALEITTASSGGAHNLGLVQVLVNKELNGVKSCYLSYEIPKNQLWLISDKGQGAAGEGQPGDQRTLENSQCQIALGHAKRYVTQDAVKLKLDIQFRPTFSGKRHIFVYAKDQSGLSTNWQSRGDWQVN